MIKAYDNDPRVHFTGVEGTPGYFASKFCAFLASAINQNSDTKKRIKSFAGKWTLYATDPKYKDSPLSKAKLEEKKISFNGEYYQQSMSGTPHDATILGLAASIFYWVVCNNNDKEKPNIYLLLNLPKKSMPKKIESEITDTEYDLIYQLYNNIKSADNIDPTSNILIPQKKRYRVTVEKDKDTELSFMAKASIICNKDVFNICNFHNNLRRIWPALEIKFTDENGQNADSEFYKNFENDKTQKHQNIQEQIINHIFSKAEQYPLFSYYLKKDDISPYVPQLSMFIKHAIFPGKIEITITQSSDGEKDVYDYSVSFNNSETLPLIKNLIEWLVSLSDKTCHGEETAPYDFFSFLEFCSLCASENDIFSEGKRHSFSKADVINLVHCNPSRSLFFSNAHIDKLFSISCKTELIKSSNGHYQFTLKHYRLLCLGLYLSKSYDPHNPEKTFFEIKKYSKLSSADTSVDIDIICSDRFDSIVFLGTSLVVSLNEKDRTSFINYLCNKAKNFEHSEREDQTVAIFLLTNILNECRSLISYHLREEIFVSSYGTTAYDFQLSNFQLLNPSSSFYKTCIDNKKKDASTLLPCSSFAAGQPYFFFLYHITEPSYEDTLNSLLEKEDSELERIELDIKSCEMLAYWIRNYTWEIYNKKKTEKVSILQRLIVIIFKCIDVLSNDSILSNQQITEQSLHNSYAFQALAYSLANIRLLYNQGTGIFDTIDDNINETFYSALFYYDYISRVTNIEYQKFCFPNNTEPVNLYLLCGFHRFISTANNYHHLNRYSLSDTMFHKYCYFLKNERGRYRVLLARLLSFSDFFEGKHFDESADILNSIYNDIIDDKIKDRDFLNYDHVSISRIKTSLTDGKPLLPAKWY